MSATIVAAVGAGAALYGAYNSYEAGRSAKKLSKKKAAMQEKEAGLAIAQNYRDEKEFLGEQQTLFAKSGVMLEGTPLDVLEETRRRFKRQRESIKELGSAQAAQSLQQGRLAFNQGLAGATSGIASAASYTASGIKASRG